MEDVIKLIANQKQFNIIRAALDLYSRIGSGQISIGLSDLCLQNHDQFGPNIHTILSDDFERDITRLKMKMFGDGETVMGVGSRNLSENFKIAHDISQTIRHGIAHLKNTQPPHSMEYDTPIKYSQEELPVFEVNSDGKEEDQTQES